MKTTLPSGTRLLLDWLPGSPVTAIYLWVSAGSCEEGPGEHGGAHFVEHLLFKGTPAHPGGEAVRRIEALGGDLNAFTGYDELVLHATVPAPAFAETLTLLADMLKNSVFDPEDVRLERQVILDEIRGGEDEPDRVLEELVAATAFRVHPIGRPIIGTGKSIRALNPASLRALRDRLIRPGRLVVSVSGDFDPAIAQALVRELFPGEGPVEARAPRSPEPPQSSPRVAVTTGRFSEPMVEFAYPGVPHGHPDAPALELMMLALGEGPGSALGGALQLDAGLVTGTWGGSSPERDVGLLRIGCTPLGGKLVETIERSLEIIERFRAGDISRSSLARARAQALGSRLWATETVDGRAHDRALFEDLCGDPDADRAMRGLIEAVDRAALRRVAAEYLRPERLSVGVLLPEGESSPAVVRSLFRRKRPPIAAATEEPISRVVLEDGLTLVVEPLDGPPVVAIRAVALGGQLAENPSNAGISELWSRTVGVPGLGARALSEWLDLRAAALNGVAGANTLGVRLELPADRLDEGLDLFTELLCRPRFDEDDLRRGLAELREEVRLLPDNPEGLASQTAAAMLFGRHPYGLPVHGSARSLDRLGARELLALHRRLITRDNLVMTVVGSVEAEPVVRRLAARLSALPAGPARVNPRPPARFPTHTLRRRLQGDREQAHVVQAWRGARFSDPDAEALAVAATVLGGQSGRLFEALRERRGLAYHVSAECNEGWDTGSFSAYIGLDPDNAIEGARLMRAEVERLAAEGPTAEEVDRARQALLGSLAMSRQRCASRALELACWERYGRDARESRAMAERLLWAVTPAQVQRALASRVQGGVEVVLGASK